MPRAIVAIAIGLIGSFPHPSSAQVVAMDPRNPADVARTEANTLTHIMSGITLTKLQEDSARRIIHVAQAAIIALPPDEPKRLTKVLALFDTRNARLRALFPDSVTRRRFDENAAAMIHVRRPPP